MNIFSIQNSTLGIDDYGSTIDSLLNKKTTKYDLYTYDPIYTRKYSNHFIDLKKWLPEDHLKLYSSGDARKICVYDDQWVGLVKFYYIKNKNNNNNNNIK